MVLGGLPPGRVGRRRVFNVAPIRNGRGFLWPSHLLMLSHRMQSPMLIDHDDLYDQTHL